VKLGQVLPHSEETERAVLACVLLQPHTYDVLVDLGIDQDMFHIERHQALWSCYARLAVLRPHTADATGAPAPDIDLRTIQADLEKRGEMEMAGGVSFLSGIDLDLPDVGRVATYAGILKDRARRREIIKGCARIATATADGENELDDMEERLTELTESAEGAAAACTVATILDRKATTRVRTMTTGYPALDELTRGLSAGSLVTVYGPPGSGKSALMMSMANRMQQTDIPTAYYSLEMPGEDLVARLLAQRSGVPASLIRACYWRHPETALPPGTHDLTENQVQKIDAARESYEVGPLLQLWGDGDLGSGFAPQMIGRAARAGAAVVFVDYLQLAVRKGARESTEEATTRTSRALKALAAQHGVVVVQGSQISRQGQRAAEDSETPNGMPAPPALTALRQSGAIEQDSLLCMACVMEPRQTIPGSGGSAFNGPTKGEVHVMKNRNGPLGAVEMTWDGPTMTWSERDTSWD
jgi:replicative DNA helicase